MRKELPLRFDPLSGRFIDRITAEKLVRAYKEKPRFPWDVPTVCIDFSWAKIDEIILSWRKAGMHVAGLRIYFGRKNDKDIMLIVGTTQPDVSKNCLKEVTEIKDGSNKFALLFRELKDPTIKDCDPDSLGSTVYHPIIPDELGYNEFIPDDFIDYQEALGYVDAYRKKYNLTNIGTIYLEFLTEKINVARSGIWKNSIGARFYFGVDEITDPKKPRITGILVSTVIKNTCAIEIPEMEMEINGQKQKVRALDFASLCPPDCNCTCDTSSLARTLYSDVYCGCLVKP